MLRGSLGKKVLSYKPNTKVYSSESLTCEREWESNFSLKNSLTPTLTEFWWLPHYLAVFSQGHEGITSGVSGRRKSGNIPKMWRWRVDFKNIPSSITSRMLEINQYWIFLRLQDFKFFRRKYINERSSWLHTLASRRRYWKINQVEKETRRNEWMLNEWKKLENSEMWK